MSDDLDICKNYDNLQISDKMSVNDILRIGTKCSCKSLCNDITKDAIVQNTCYTKCVEKFKKPIIATPNINDYYHIRYKGYANSPYLWPWRFHHHHHI
jgi:hypothetical protein